MTLIFGQELEAGLMHASFGIDHELKATTYV